MSATILPFPAGRSASLSVAGMSGAPAHPGLAGPKPQLSPSAISSAAGERLRRALGRVFPSLPLTLADDVALADLPDWPRSGPALARAIAEEFGEGEDDAALLATAAEGLVQTAACGGTLGDLVDACAEAWG